MSDKALFWRLLNKPHAASEGEQRKIVPLLVLLHGWLGSSLDWESVVVLLPPSVAVVAIDLPGHGESPPWCEDEITFERVGAAVATATGEAARFLGRCLPPLLVGYSLGGRIALQLCRANPEAWSGMILLGAHIGLGTEQQRAERRASDRAVAEELAAVPFEEFLRRWYKRPLFSTLARSPQLLEDVIQRRIANPPSAPAAVLTALSLGNQQPLIEAEDCSFPRKLAFPVRTFLVAGGEDDRFCEQYQMISVITGAPLIVLEGAGHALLAESPQGVAQVIGGFWGE